MKKLLPLLFLFATTMAVAQPQLFSTKKGDITITPVLHGSLVIQWKNRTIFVDPYGGAGRYAAFPAPDLVVISHIHGDHMNKETLSGLDLSKTTLVSPQSVHDSLTMVNFKKKKILANGADLKWKGINIMAVPMYNLPETPDSRHPKGRGNGYVLTVAGERIYISGDTEDIPEMRQLQDIDVAFVCMNLPYTMNIEQAADAVLAFEPAIMYPYHYRGQEGLSDVEGFKKLVDAGNKAIEIRLVNWYPE